MDYIELIRATMYVLLLALPLTEALQYFDV